MYFFLSIIVDLVDQVNFGQFESIFVIFVDFCRNLRILSITAIFVDISDICRYQRYLLIVVHFYYGSQFNIDFINTINFNDFVDPP